MGIFCPGVISKCVQCLNEFDGKTLYYTVVNRPSVAGAVLQTHLSLSEQYFSSKSSKHHHSSTIRARDLTCLHNVRHLSRFRCQMNAKQNNTIFLSQLVELRRGGPFIKPSILTNTDICHGDKKGGASKERKCSQIGFGISCLPHLARIQPVSENCFFAWLICKIHFHCGYVILVAKDTGPKYKGIGCTVPIVFSIQGGVFIGHFMCR